MTLLEAVARFRRLAATAQGVAVAAIQGAAPETRAQLILATPRDTGLLQSSWQVTPRRDGSTFRNRQFYAVFRKPIGKWYGIMRKNSRKAVKAQIRAHTLQTLRGG